MLGADCPAARTPVTAPSGRVGRWNKPPPADPTSFKHATVSFGQILPPDVMHEATRLARQAKLFLAIGSSLVVEPAASLPRLAKQHGGRLVIINRDPTPLDDLAEVVIRAGIGETLMGVDERLGLYSTRPRLLGGGSAPR